MDRAGPVLFYPAALVRQLSLDDPVPGEWALHCCWDPLQHRSVSRRTIPLN